jgi:hypothetical protein
MRQILKRTVSLVALLAGTACGKIPMAYQGTYVDHARGARIDLGADSGTFLRPSSGGGVQGPALKMQAQGVNLAALSSGAPGLFLKGAEGQGSEIEVYWLWPRAETRKESQGWVTLEAEVLYTTLNSSSRQKITGIQVRYCTNGHIAIDTVGGRFNGGCGVDSELLSFEKQTRSAVNLTRSPGKNRLN